MKCPRCHESIMPQQNACGICGFSATFLHSYLGNQWVRLERITDAAHCLRLEDSRRTEVVLDDFERSFPQAFFAAYLGVLPNNLSVSELGFWLLNQGAFNTPSVNRRNDFGIVLVIDPAAHTTSLTLGYAIEALFNDKVTHRILQAIGSHLFKGAFGMAIESACLQCGEAMRKHARSTSWKPAPHAGDGSPDMGLQPLRGGHKPGSRPMAGFSQDTRR